MRLFRLGSLLPCCVLFSLSSAAQQPLQRDPQALVILQQALAAMGGAVPANSVATGNADLVAGSTKETATVRILTRGLYQSIEEIQTQGGSQRIVYSQGRAAESQGSSVRHLGLERVVTSQALAFPLPFIAAALGNPDGSFQYLGLEALGGGQAHHVRYWNSFSSTPSLRHLAEFSVRDVWIDAASGLPRRISYQRRDAGGAVPRIPVEVFLSDYRSIGGIAYPFLIEKSVNGTPWARITIQQVTFNTGLTDGDFLVQ